MLVKATEEDIAQYMDFVYSIALDQTRSGYPLFSDGISTKEQFVDHIWSGLRKDGQDILLFTIDGVVEGLIQFFYIEEDRYLQTNGFFINRNTAEALAEFIKYADVHFAGYDLYFGFPKRNSVAVDFLQKSGCRLVEEAYHDIFIFDGAEKPEKSNELVKVTESNFSEFREIHQTDSDTYWNSDRIYSTLSEWIIYMLYQDGVAAGYICARHGEIFSLGYRDNIFDERIYKALVMAILSDLKAAGYGHTVYFNDEESQSAALDMGFSCIGEYVLYVKSL
ncbi:MAG: hypothetical protein J1F23_09030 [Oscillospiraceae bacterium]|nr:hypothetical protein [Oscillospiraceae bacterium]